MRPPLVSHVLPFLRYVTPGPFLTMLGNAVVSGPVPSAPSKSSGADVLNLTSGARCLLITGSFWK